MNYSSSDSLPTQSRKVHPKLNHNHSQKQLRLVTYNSQGSDLQASLDQQHGLGTAATINVLDEKIYDQSYDDIEEAS